jgi:cell division protein FtsL
MNRVNALLLAMLVASSLVLVKSAYDARRLFAELDR